ncbi:MAG: hypothetical protein HOC70_14420 [Gammaproteobacteria bacterium]|jgi:tetratricopeptide (TPR) repeat protein|nr:hypothetical protein [Gammaproteobacteria bacterium]MBT5876720.1 hypothetical protein [Candidatus Latescibacterota bacterium]
MIYLHRCMLLGIGALVMMSSTGCFLFGGGSSEDTMESAIAASTELREGQMAVEEALFRADMAIEEERLDTAVIEFNRAIRADSSQVGIYFELAQLHKQLSEQYREDGNIEAALQENARGLRVLENLMAYRSRNPEPADAEMANSSADEMPMDDTSSETTSPDSMSEPAPDNSEIDATDPPAAAADEEPTD